MVFGLRSAPGTPTAAQAAGTSLYGTRANLYIGMPYGPGAYGSLRDRRHRTAVPAYAPGAGGLPAVGLRFGMSAR
ncbi:hypothetical protein [Streptomyces sp. NPDC048277]|uniref:hypothetical protein n=1 Tax=Streptomyces sp. NPDC048277 TaxID=3155027 RepID=UPI0033E18724